MWKSNAQHERELREAHRALFLLRMGYDRWGRPINAPSPKILFKAQRTEQPKPKPLTNTMNDWDILQPHVEEVEVIVVPRPNRSEPIDYSKAKRTKMPRYRPL